MLRVRDGLRRVSAWVLVVIIAVAWGGVFFPVSAQQDPARAVYDNDSLFQQLSGGARTLMELKFGRKSDAPVLPAEVTLAAVDADSLPVAVPPPNILVNNPAADASAQDTQSETTIVAGSGSVLLAGFNDSGSYSPGTGNYQFTGWSRSTNGGTTFTDMGRLPNSAAGDAGDPVLAQNNVSGSIYFATLMFFGSGVQVFKSTDNGATFGAPVNGAPGTTGFDDKEWITVDNFPGSGQGNVYLAWREFGGSNGIRLTRSTDGGATWGPSGGVSIAAGGQGAFVVVGADHSVYVFWWSGGIFVRRSTDQGVTFGSAVAVSTLIGTGVNGDLALSGGFRSSSFPHVAVNPVSGHLYVVYNDCTSAPCSTAADHGNVFLRRSTDNGATWSAALLVNDDGTTRDQFSPTIGVLPGGCQLLVAFYDRRLSANNTLIDRFGSIGIISGSTITFAPNFRITDTSFPVVIAQDPVINRTYMGDYDQIAANSSGFHVTWGDNRLSNSFHTNQPDVRYAGIAGACAGGCGPHTVHGHISTVPPSHSGNVSHEHHGQHGHTVAANCPPHAPGHSPGFFEAPYEVLSSLTAEPPGAPAFRPSLKVAMRGSVLSLYGAAEGLFVGETDEQPAQNFTVPLGGATRYYTSQLPVVRIGDAVAQVTFSGLARGRRGVWQIDVVVPQVSAGRRLPVRISYGGTEWKAAKVDVQ